jgi:hypothetical protein
MTTGGVADGASQQLPLTPTLSPVPVERESPAAPFLLAPTTVGERIEVRGRDGVGVAAELFPPNLSLSPSRRGD